MKEPKEKERLCEWMVVLFGEELYLYSVLCSSLLGVTMADDSQLTPIQTLLTLRYSITIHLRAFPSFQVFLYCFPTL